MNADFLKYFIFSLQYYFLTGPLSTLFVNKLLNDGKRFKYMLSFFGFNGYKHKTLINVFIWLLGGLPITLSFMYKTKDYFPIP